MEPLEQLIGISRHYGDNPAYVIAGGGNTSYKNEEHIWIKASGIPLAGIGKDGFVKLSREALKRIEQGNFSDDPMEREEQVKAEMKKAVVAPQNLRPSVETSLHNLIGYAYVVHTHPTLVNGLLCSRNAEKEAISRFGESALYVPYTDPGFVLFRKLRKEISAYRTRYGTDPRIILLQNHGIFVSADDPGEIRTIYREVDERILGGLRLSLPSCTLRDLDSEAGRHLRDFFSARGLQTRTVLCDLVEHFHAGTDRFLKIARPFSPDIIVYCKSNYLFLGSGMDADLVARSCMQFEEEHGYYPKVILEEGGGLTAVEEDARSVGNVLDVYLDLMKISYLSENYGGPSFMTPAQVEFIDNWEVENYRRKIAKGG